MRLSFQKIVLVFSFSNPHLQLLESISVRSQRLEKDENIQHQVKSFRGFSPKDLQKKAGRSHLWEHFNLFPELNLENSGWGNIRQSFVVLQKFCRPEQTLYHWWGYRWVGSSRFLEKSSITHLIVQNGKTGKWECVCFLNPWWIRGFNCRRVLCWTRWSATIYTKGDWVEVELSDWR